MKPLTPSTNLEKLQKLHSRGTSRKIDPMFLGILLIGGIIVVSLGIAQTSDSIVSSEDTESAGFRVGQVGDMLDQAGGWRYPIFAVFAFGIFFSIFQAFTLTMNTINTKPIKNTNFTKIDVKKIEKLAKKYPKSAMASMIDMLLRMYQSTGKLNTFDQNVTHFITILEEKISKYRNWMEYLSDSAGALGLLGTVVGMWMTFQGGGGGGTLPPEVVIQGMGIALITTLLGLIVSLILNLLKTVINNHFSSGIEDLMRKSDELRFAILTEDKGPEGTWIRRATDVEKVAT